MLNFKPSPGFARLQKPLIGLVAVAFLSVPGIYWTERSSLAVWARKTERFVPKKPPRNVYHFEGAKSPATIPVVEATLADADPIIGIEAEGKFRAYQQSVMSAKARHVLNDVIGGKAVTVTFCDLDDCARAFVGGEGSSRPLDIDLAGLDDGGMLLSVDDVVYFQKTAESADLKLGKDAPPFPYASYPVTRTTWGEWKALHPDTDIYEFGALKAAEPKTPGPKSPERGSAAQSPSESNSGA